MSDGTKWDEAREALAKLAPAQPENPSARCARLGGAPEDVVEDALSAGEAAEQQLATRDAELDEAEKNEAEARMELRAAEKRCVELADRLELVAFQRDELRDTSSRAAARVASDMGVLLAEVERERDEERSARELAIHKVITCGVAASHPDKDLSRRGVYGGAWDSPQAEEVRALRERAERAERERDEAIAEAKRRACSAETVAATEAQRDEAERERDEARQAAAERAAARDGALEVTERTRVMLQTAESREAGLRRAVEEVTRRAELPIATAGAGRPSTREGLNAAINRCVRLAIDHVTEPIRAALSPPTEGGHK